MNKKFVYQVGNNKKVTRKLLTPECSYEDGKQRIVAILMIHACLQA